MKNIPKLLLLLGTVAFATNANAQESSIDNAKKEFEKATLDAVQKLITSYQIEIDRLTEAGKTEEASRLKAELLEFAAKHKAATIEKTFDFARDLKAHIDEYVKASELETDLLREEKRVEVAKKMLKEFNGKSYEYKLVVTDIEKIDDNHYKLLLDESKGLDLPYLVNQNVDFVVLELTPVRARKLRPGDHVRISGRIDLAPSDYTSNSREPYQNERGKTCYPVIYFALTEQTVVNPLTGGIRKSSSDSGFGGSSAGNVRYLQLGLYDVETKVVSRE
jgi:hypothetical protein